MNFKEIISDLDLSDQQREGIRQLEADVSFFSDDFSWQAECFIISWLRDELISDRMLDKAVLTALGDQIQERMPFLQEMLTGKGDKYHDFLRRMGPYLMYMGDETCFGAMKSFSIEFGRALENAGYQVIYVSTDEMTEEFFLSLVGMTFRGIIAFQTPTFSMKVNDGRYLHDLVDVPLYWMDFDHPCWFGHYITDTPEKTTFLCVDRYYASYIEKVQHKKAVFFPPAAEPTELSSLSYDDFVSEKKKIIEYPLSFVGTCQDHLSDDLTLIRKKQPELYPLACEYADRMIAEPRKPQDIVLSEMLSDSSVMKKYFNRSEHFSDEEFDHFLQSWAFIGKDVVHHLRRNVVKTILEAGIELHVFSETFEEFSEYSNLHIHPSVGYDRTSDIYRKSLISLNVMTGHKAGFTERIANSMLCGALSFTEGTEYIDEEFRDGEDIETFRLTDEDIAGIPSRLQQLSGDKDGTLQIAYNGMKRALADHTWDKRVEQFTELFYITN